MTRPTPAITAHLQQVQPNGPESTVGENAATVSSSSSVATVSVPSTSPAAVGTDATPSTSTGITHAHDNSPKRNKSEQAKNSPVLKRPKMEGVPPDVQVDLALAHGENSKQAKQLRQYQKRLENEIQRLQAERDQLKQELQLSEVRRRESFQRQMMQVVENDLNCFLCNDFLKEPTVVECGHCFCSHCITVWMQERREAGQTVNCRRCGAAIRDARRLQDVDGFFTRIYALASSEAQENRKQILQQRRDEQEVRKAEHIAMLVAALPTTPTQTHEQLERVRLAYLCMTSGARRVQLDNESQPGNPMQVSVGAQNRTSTSNAHLTRSASERRAHSRAAEVTVPHSASGTPRANIPPHTNAQPSVPISSRNVRPQSSGSTRINNLRGRSFARPAITRTTPPSGLLAALSLTRNEDLIVTEARRHQMPTEQERTNQRQAISSSAVNAAALTADNGSHNGDAGWRRLSPTDLVRQLNDVNPIVNIQRMDELYAQTPPAAEAIPRNAPTLNVREPSRASSSSSGAARGSLVQRSTSSTPNGGRVFVHNGRRDERAAHGNFQIPSLFSLHRPVRGTSPIDHRVPSPALSLSSNASSRSDPFAGAGGYPREFSPTASPAPPEILPRDHHAHGLIGEDLPHVNFNALSPSQSAEHVVNLENMDVGVGVMQAYERLLE